MTIDHQAILSRYFSGDGLEMILIHSRQVADLALAACRAVAADERTATFAEEAALLHDIGICRVHAPGIGMHGPHPYIMHGILGRQILEEEGLPQHALICERHIGVGLTVDDIIAQKLPLPLRDMVPQTLAEQIVCFADLFYSKTPGKLLQRKSPERVRHNLAVHGDHKLQIFDSWMKRFGGALDLNGRQRAGKKE